MFRAQPPEPLNLEEALNAITSQISTVTNPTHLDVLLKALRDGAVVTDQTKLEAVKAALVAMTVSSATIDHIVLTVGDNGLAGRVGALKSSAEQRVEALFQQEIEALNEVANKVAIETAAEELLNGGFTKKQDAIAKLLREAAPSAANTALAGVKTTLNDATLLHLQQIIVNNYIEIFTKEAKAKSATDLLGLLKAEAHGAANTPEKKLKALRVKDELAALFPVHDAQFVETIKNITKNAAIANIKASIATYTQVQLADLLKNINTAHTEDERRTKWNDGLNGAPSVFDDTAHKQLNDADLDELKLGAQAALVMKLKATMATHLATANLAGAPPTAQSDLIGRLNGENPVRTPANTNDTKLKNIIDYLLTAQTTPNVANLAGALALPGNVNLDILTSEQQAALLREAKIHVLKLEENQAMQDIKKPGVAKAAEKVKILKATQITDTTLERLDTLLELYKEKAKVAEQSADKNTANNIDEMRTKLNEIHKELSVYKAAVEQAKDDRAQPAYNIPGVQRPFSDEAKYKQYLERHTETQLQAKIDKIKTRIDSLNAVITTLDQKATLIGAADYQPKTTYENPLIISPLSQGMVTVVVHDAVPMASSTEAEQYIAAKHGAAYNPANALGGSVTIGQLQDDVLRSSDKNNTVHVFQVDVNAMKQSDGSRDDTRSIQSYCIRTHNKEKDSARIDSFSADIEKLKSEKRDPDGFFVSKDKQIPGPRSLELAARYLDILLEHIKDRTQPVRISPIGLPPNFVEALLLHCDHRGIKCEPTRLSTLPTINEKQKALFKKQWTTEHKHDMSKEQETEIIKKIAPGMSRGM